MDKKIEETREFLQTIGMPKAQQADICCYVILAMAGIKPDMLWSEATNEWIRIHDIIQFVNTFYGMSYAENSRETFRKQALHRFRTAALIEDNGKATNSPNYRYRLTEEIVKILRTMETPAWKESIKRFLCYHEKLIDLYASKKKMTMMPVNINGENFKFSVGKHNELQKAIIEEFAPRFRDNVLVDINKIEEKIKELKKNEDSTKGVKRDSNKKVFNKYKRFFEIVMRKWIADHEEKINYFYHNLHILFCKVSEFHDINPKEWIE